MIPPPPKHKRTITSVNFIPSNFTSYTVHLKLHILHCTPQTSPLHCTPQTSHLTLYTIPSNLTLHALHPTETRPNTRTHRTTKQRTVVALEALFKLKPKHGIRRSSRNTEGGEWNPTKSPPLFKGPHLREFVPVFPACAHKRLLNRGHQLLLGRLR